MSTSCQHHLHLGRVTLSDRASDGVYPDKSGPAIEACIEHLLPECILVWSRVLLHDDQDAISHHLIRLVDEEHCAMVITTGGTGPTLRDVTPEATLAVLDKVLPGFGEIMRMRTFEVAPTSILSRATAGMRKSSLIINIPGRPSAVEECLKVIGPALREILGLMGAAPVRGRRDAP
jgi:molybdopterin adenylyltransferase